MAQRIRYVKVGARRGFTLLEILVVIGIVLVLMSLLIGGFGDMLRARRLANSVEKVVSTIHYARTRAISDNAITHVRVENRAKDMQYIGVYRFRKVGEALQATTQEAVKVDLGGWIWTADPNTTDPSKNCLQLDKHELEVGVYFETEYDDAKIWDSARNRPKTQKEMVQSDANLYYDESIPHNGVNVLPRLTPTYPGPLVTYPDHKLLYFMPDGTASENVLLFVRDHKALRWVQVWKGGLIRSGEIDRLDAFKDLN